MQRNLIFILVCMLIFLAFPQERCLPWKPDPNHKKLTKETLQYSNNDLNPALIKAGWANGLDTIVRPGKTIRGIIVDHSQLADAIVLDLFHHFYNYFTELGLAGEISNAEWTLISAQYPYSLAHFPEAWYLAHAAKTEAERLKNMDYSAAILGQCLHLLQDATNAEHTRGDQHLLVGEDEIWAKKNADRITYSFSPNNWTKILAPPDISIFELWDPSSLLPRLSVLWKSIRFPGDEVANILDPTLWHRAGAAGGATLHITPDKGFDAWPFPDPNHHTNINEIDWAHPTAVTDYQGNELKLNYVYLKDKDGNLTSHKLTTVDVQSYMNWKAGVGPLITYFDDLTFQDYVDGQFPMGKYYGRLFFWYLFRHHLNLKANADGILVEYLGHDDELHNGGLAVFVNTPGGGREPVILKNGSTYFPIGSLMKGQSVQLEFSHPGNFAGVNPTYTVVYRGASTWADDETVVAQTIYAAPSNFLLVVKSGSSAYLHNIGRRSAQILNVNGSHYDGEIPTDVLSSLDGYQSVSAVTEPLFAHRYQFLNNSKYEGIHSGAIYVPGPHEPRCGSEQEQIRNNYSVYKIKDVTAPFEYLNGTQMGNAHGYFESYTTYDSVEVYYLARTESRFNYLYEQPYGLVLGLITAVGENGIFRTEREHKSFHHTGCGAESVDKYDYNYTYVSPLGKLQIETSYATFHLGKIDGVFLLRTFGTYQYSSKEIERIRIIDLQASRDDGLVATTQLYAVIFPYVDLTHGKTYPNGSDPTSGEGLSYFIKVLAASELSSTPIDPFGQSSSFELSQNITSLLENSDDPTDLAVEYVRIDSKYLVE